MSTRPYLQKIDEKILKPDISGFERAVYIHHDQLNLSVFPDWSREEKPLLIFIESEEKGRSLPFHKKKLIYLLSSMRHFALECQEEGFPVWYYSTKGHYDDAFKTILEEYKDLVIRYMSPAEWDSRERVRKIAEANEGRMEELDNNFFLAEADEYKEKVAEGWTMEYFYREMRKKTGYLMDGETPEGGEWNYDEENREKLPADHPVPEIAETEVDEVTSEVIDLVNSEFGDHYGESSDFSYAVTRRQALYRLNEFIDERLDEFGPYEDAMAQDEDVIFHSHLSLNLNNGLLLPKEICDRAEEAYKEDKARINSVEGLIRQIIGWREYIRIYYEGMMPEVRRVNHFGFENDLPSFFWTGETKMNCVKQCLKPVIKDGYSHHIPRLMVLSNISNLTETDPRQLNRWFHLAYVDAYEWVVLPNVLGMSTFADGGVLASKPYVSSGNYINKMSDYCKHCDYKITKKTGEEACPFNYLYWNFVDKQRETFTQNGRANFMVNMFDKKSDEDKKEILESAETYISSLERSENY